MAWGVANVTICRINDIRMSGCRSWCALLATYPPILCPTNVMDGVMEDGRADGVVVVAVVVDDDDDDDDNREEEVSKQSSISWVAT